MATRRTAGAISLRSSSHLPPIDDSMLMLVNPVTLPPGRACDATKPRPTGSETWANTIGSGPQQASFGGIGFTDNIYSRGQGAA
jgi:hypothetical protein